ncbi:MAG: ECF transporter S component [Eubacteriales bacterium]|nr:ECF transporter S component [Eubacteriales bacterium]MDD4421807.1 ECF transporter S component [Eubacteriales bacterium]HBR31689.1 ECF transporter S component [Clostridiales bacterium]
MNTNKTLLWITRTAVLIALLITLQWGLGALTAGNQFIVGSAVNFVLIIAVITSGFFSGFTVAIASPFMAFLVGVGPAKLLLIPFISIGNAVLVIVWFLLVKKTPKNINEYTKQIVALVAGAVLKFITLYFLIVKYAIPVLLKLPEGPAAVMSASFSWPQLVTASIGGVLAILVMPVMNKITKRAE